MIKALPPSALRTARASFRRIESGRESFLLFSNNYGHSHGQECSRREDIEVQGTGFRFLGN
jgi:hypothetical protein